MKKVLYSLCLFVLLFNFIFANRAYAAGAVGQTKDTKYQNDYRTDNMEYNTPGTKLLEDGVADDGTGTERAVNTNSFGTTIMGTILGILAGLLNIIIFQLDVVLGALSYGTETKGGSTVNNDFNYFFTIERCVFNRIALFNINYFNTADTYKVGDVTIKANQSVNDIKASVASVYYIVRLVATAIALLVLIYIGIRMATSTLSDDKARYKKMLISWIESIVVLFLLTYIMVAVITFGEMLINVFYNLEQQIITNNNTQPEDTFEIYTRNHLLSNMFGSSGLQYAVNSLTYWILLFTQIKYFWVYLKRVLMVGFLIMIAPVITVTYAIDKIGDGRAQAFSVWMKEFVTNVLIQPLHALIYLVFMFSAGEIAKVSPLIAIAFIFGMGAVERMVKVIFDLRGLVSLRGVDKLGKKQ